MSQRGVGAAVVLDPEAPGPGILTERDVLKSLGAGEDPDSELVADHLTTDLVSPPRTGRSRRPPSR